MISKLPPLWNFNLTWSVHTNNKMISKLPTLWNFNLTWSVHKDEMISTSPAPLQLQSDLDCPQGWWYQNCHPMELQIDLDCPTPLEGSEHEFLGKKDANLMSFLRIWHSTLQSFCWCWLGSCDMLQPYHIGEVTANEYSDSKAACWTIVIQSPFITSFAFPTPCSCASPGFSIRLPVSNSLWIVSVSESACRVSVSFRALVSESVFLSFWILLSDSAWF